MKATALVCVALLGCASSGELGGDLQLGLQAVSDDGREGEVACIILPILGGARVLSEVSVDDAFVILADASNEEVLLRFESLQGVELAQPRQIKRSDLELGVDEELSLRSPKAEQYVIRLSSECEE